MFPFNLPGPLFLVFFAVFALAVFAFIYGWQRFAEGGELPKLSFDDPLAIAYLRGGPEEAICVAAASLLDRDLLILDGGRLIAGPKSDPAFVRRPLESAILERTQQRKTAAELMRDPTLRATADRYARDLELRRLVPDDRQRAARRYRYMLGLAVLWIVAGIKLIVAIAAGRSNILLLLVLAVLVAFGGRALLRGRRTALGDRLLADLGRLFARLRARSATLRPGAASADALMLSAVFGLAALPRSYAARGLFAAKRDGDTSSSSSNSCGSGSGCSGSSCGGGGGGGGCGGCGGG